MSQFNFGNKNKKNSPFGIFLASAVGAFTLFAIFAGFYSDWQWFKVLGQTDVYSKQLILKVILFFAVGTIAGFTLWLSATLAYRVRPMQVPQTPADFALARYREALDSFRKVIFLAAPVVFGALVGISAAGQWKTFLLWQNSQPFNQVDQHFGKDISFFVFELPFLRTVLGFAFTILIASMVINFVIHYLYGGLRPAASHATNHARKHLMIFLGLLALLKAAAYYLDRFALAVKSDSLITGLKYTDVHALVPAKNILIYIAIGTGILFFVSLIRPGWSLPFISFAVMLGSSIIIGGIYPAFVQQFQVKPSELAREEPYIKRNLEATKVAYGLENVQITDYQAIDNPNQAVLTEDAATLSNIRLLDPTLLSPTYRNLQQIRGFYAFADSLDIDRYLIDEVKRGTVIAVREVNLDGIPDSQRNWFNDRMVFTHGYGVVAAYENVSNADGSPKFFESNVPPSGSLQIDEPRIYFGEQSPTYSIVGSGDGQNRELDYPDDKSANGQTNNTYDGTGGVEMGSLFQRAIFAVNYQDPNILLSNQISSESEILYGRNPKDRVQKVAPWLKLDGDPYPAVIDGKIQWILDGYTTSNDYPYSARISMRDATADSVNAQAASLTISSGNITYIRNAVKATVDAYDGTVHIYAWDESDPILKAWMASFPGVVESKASIPAGVLDHIRYPEDMFKVQRDILARYHVSDAQAFYSGQDFWIVPDDPTKPTIKQAQPPYYLSLKMPGQSEAAFQLTSAYAPAKRQTLAAFMAVNSDHGSDYGTIRVLQLPRNTTIPGPTQVQNNFESDPEVSTKLSLLRQGGSEVELGNLLSLPVGGGLLYFEPVYVRASQGDGYPLLRKVLVSFGSKVAFEDDLATALSKVFSGQTVSTPTDENGTGTTTPNSQTPAQVLAKAIEDANRALEEGQAALAQGDFAAYGLAQEKLADALRRVTDASSSFTGTNTVTPTPSPSATQ